MGKKIILVEDETNIRSMYSTVLQEDGYEVVEISEGKRALEELESSDWDLLLLDIMLPKLDGIELLKRLKSNPATKDKPVLILTNLKDDSIKDEALKLGANEFLVKSGLVPGDIVLAVKKYVFTE